MPHKGTKSYRRRWYMLPTVLALLLSHGLARAQEAPSSERPNIVFILADDLGYMDVDAYAARIRGIERRETFYETPNIDRLVDEGTAFSQAYVHQLCSPTRVSLLTGRNAAEIGFATAAPFRVETYYNQGLEPPEGYHPQDAIYHSDKIDIPQALRNGSSLTALPSGQPADGGRDAVTFAEAMPDHRAAFIGKWHIGGHGAEGYQPFDQGFEALAYYDAGASPYFDWRTRWSRDEPQFSTMPQDRWPVGHTGSANDADYLTDALTQEAVHFIEDRADADDGPFLLYLSHFAVHGPLQAPEHEVSSFAEKPTRGWNGQNHATYAAMIKHLDESVGDVVRALERTGLEDNTLVIFMSDNGGVTFELGGETIPSTSNAPFKGGKATLFEGGVRVPLVFRWKGQVPAGEWIDRAVHATDLFPTVLEVGGYDVGNHEVDGQSLFPMLTGGQATYTRDTFYWHYPFNVKVTHPDDGHVGVDGRTPRRQLLLQRLRFFGLYFGEIVLLPDIFFEVV